MMNRARIHQALKLVGVLAATGALVAITWRGTFGVAQYERIEAEAHIKADVANQAALFAEVVQFDLLEVDQTLRVLSQAWEDNPGHFHLLSWRNHLVLLNQISPELFITDEHGSIRDATVPELVGTDVRGSDYFRTLSERIFDDGRMFISPSALNTQVREWHVNLARPVHDRDGSFAGVIVAVLRLNAIGNLYRISNLGGHGVIAVVGLENGGLRLVAGSNPVYPGTSIATSEMFKAIQADPDSTWIGRTALDGVERVHAFHRIADRNLAVVVAVDRDEAMHATNSWVIAAYLFAGGISVLLLLLAAIVIRGIRAAYRREVALGHERAVLASASTELELAKATADAKTMQLDATLDGMSDGVAMFDGDMQLVQWNQRYPDIAGVPVTILRIGLPMEDILRAQATAGVFATVDIEAEVARQIADLRAGNFAAALERTLPDGRIVELRWNRLPDGGFATLYTDITARRESMGALREANAVAAERATRAMSRFVAIVSHEIRTSFNVLLNSLNLLAGSEMAATQKALLDRARQSGDALLALINDILEMSHMEVGQLALRPSLFPLRPLVQGAIDMFGIQAAERGVVLRDLIAHDVPDELYEDRGRLRQVLVNLLSNAVTFAAAGEVQVIVELCGERDERRIRLAVRDRGPVIPGSDAAPRSTGLGLTICRHLVARMGGEIGCSVWTMDGRVAGNEFWLTLPIKPVPREAPSAPARPAVLSRRRLPRTRILLVEDIHADQRVIATRLRREGHLVDVAGNGPAAMEAAAHQPYDLILMDFFIPGMGGSDAARRIRALGGPAAAVPILALTADPCPEDQAACTAAGINGLLGKPIGLHELLNAIAQHVGPHRSEVPPITPPELPILSTARLNELRATLPEDTLANLVEDRLFELSEHLSLLMEAVRQKAADEVVTHAHAMAGMAAEYGMATLEARLRTLLEVVRQTPEAAGPLSEELEAELFRAATALRQTFHIELV
jgi:signal transduction histidine kinase/DNA-binding response OmpR family regulator